MTAARWLVALAATTVALVLQVSLFPHVAWHGIVPNLSLLVVVAAALTVEAPFALLLGFTAGVALDLAPPADHVAGRWALALTVVAFLAARVRQDVRPTALAVVGTVAAASFAAGTRRAPDAVRFGLASPPPEVLRAALHTLANLARALPEDAGPE